MFLAKTFAAHCSEVSQMEISLDRGVLFSCGVAEKAVYKWKVDGDFNLYFNRNVQKIGSILQEGGDDSDIFNEVPGK